MADSAVNFLLKQLSVWLDEETKLLGGLRVEAQLIHNQLEQMKASLRVADSKEENDPNLKEWLRQIREIAYDVEDVLESYMVRFSRRRSHGIMVRIKNIYASIKSLKAKYHMASEIKALKSKAENAHNAYKNNHEALLAGSSSSSGVASASASAECDDGRDDALLLEEADVVGIEGPKMQLLDCIFSTVDYTLKVISVVGMGGLGKTTLVKKLYDDPSVKENIDLHVWINVSDTYKVENLLRDMIMKLLDEVKQAPPSTLQSMNLVDMKHFIHNFLRDRKYIIVLDDVWSTNAWEALRYAFPRSNTHGQGCIIISTRSYEVGEGACIESGRHVYELQPLPPHKAEELFHKKAFHGELSCPEHLKEFSENILKRCDGLPLAIVVIGGALATKRNDFEEWRRFSLGLGSVVQGDIPKRMSKVLSLSYYDLPHYLKSCLLYLSIFPEDHLLERGTIVRLWMAEGFVEAKQGKTMEEIAEGYLIELFNRSVIQLAKTSRDGRPSKFRMHDLVREYLISKATEQMVAGEGKTETGWNARIRRLALDDEFLSLTEPNDNYKCLRTLLFFGSVGFEWKSNLHKVLGGGCKMLKELDLRGAPLDEIPDEVFKLYCLKYLSLRNTNISIISKSIGNLEKLETLDLKGCKVTELPFQIQMLQRLQYLLVYRYELTSAGRIEFGYIQHFKARFDVGQLLHLKKLYYIDASVNIKGMKVVKQIGRLKELRRLGIVRLRKEDGKELCSSLANLSYLTTLIISSIEEDEELDLEYYLPPTSLQYLRQLVLEGRLEQVPQWIPSLNAVVDLRLLWSKIGEDEDPLEHLEVLPNLKVLSLKCAYEGEQLIFKASGFQRLTELDVFDMGKLRRMKVEKGSMQHLNKMEIDRCRAMMELPTGIEHLANLEDVSFWDMAKEFVEKLFEEKKKEGSQWRLAHVADIYVGDFVDDEWVVKRM